MVDRPRGGGGADEALDYVAASVRRKRGLGEFAAAQVQGLVPGQIDVLGMLTRLARGEVETAVQDPDQLTRIPMVGGGPGQKFAAAQIVGQSLEDWT